MCQHTFCKGMLGLEQAQKLEGTKVEMDLRPVRRLEGTRARERGVIRGFLLCHCSNILISKPPTDYIEYKITRSALPLLSSQLYSAYGV